MGLSVLYRKKVELFFKYSFYCVGIAFLLCGCASYRVKPLRKLTKETAQYVQEKNNIQVCASRLNKKEFIKYVNGAHFSNKSVLVPVLITIHNGSCGFITCEAREIALSSLSADEVANTLKIGFFGSSLAALVASFIGIGEAGSLLYLAGLFGKSEVIAWTGIGLACMAYPLSLGIAHWTQCSNREAFKKLMLVDLQNKILSHVDLMPGDDASKLIIAKDDQLVEPFKMRIRQVGTNKITEFVVALPPLAADKK